MNKNFRLFLSWLRKEKRHLGSLERSYRSNPGRQEDPRTEFTQWICLQPTWPKDLHLGSHGHLHPEFQKAKDSVSLQVPVSYGDSILALVSANHADFLVSLANSMLHSTVPISTDCSIWATPRGDSDDGVKLSFQSKLYSLDIHTSTRVWFFTDCKKLHIEHPQREKTVR